jgi:FkbM family methyltransferase
MLEKLKRYYRFYFKNPPKAKISFLTKVERHGTIYGGWNIIKNSLNSDSIVYSFGIGEDISFDLSIIKIYNCSVYGFDPTPKVISWLASQNLPSQFVFNPTALSDKDGKLTFYSPENEENVSHTVVKHHNSKEITVNSKCLKSLMNDLGHSHIDLLKMDIEGFEYEVIANMILENIRPKQILIEFHHFFPEIGNRKTEETIEFLEKNNYKLFSIADSFCEYSFVLN